MFNELILKNKSYMRFIAFILIIGIFAISCNNKNNLNEYEVTTVTKGDMKLYVTKTGEVVSENEISVYTTSNQRVQKVFFKEGDNVKEGDVVVTFYEIDKDEVLRDINAKELEIRQYRRNYNNAIELAKIGGESRVNVEDAEITLRKAELELASLRDDYSLIKSEIKSPVDGVITEMTADEDYRVDTDTTLFTVSDTKNIKIEVELSDLQMKNIEVGQRVEVTSDVLGDTILDGYVSEISGVSEKSDSLDESVTVVTIKLNDETQEHLRPGTTISASIFYQDKSDIIKVPYSSLISEDGKYYAYKVNSDNTVSKVEVEIGIYDTSYYEIVSGLNENDKIITIVDENLEDGSKITVVDPSSRSFKQNQNNGGNRNDRPPM